MPVLKTCRKERKEWEPIWESWENTSGKGLPEEEKSVVFKLWNLGVIALEISLEEANRLRKEKGIIG
jgi:hypothetical protein